MTLEEFESLEMFEDYEYTTGNINDIKLMESIGLIELNDGDVISFDGGFCDGVRGVDHNNVLSGLGFDSWEELHNNVSFVRLVPESMTALVSGKMLSGDILEVAESFGYVVEEY